MSGQRRPELLRLMDERRNDHEADADQRADDDEIQDEDREPAREARRADRQDLLPLDQPHDRAESDREEAAHVDEQQHVADEERAPHAR